MCIKQSVHMAQNCKAGFRGYQHGEEDLFSGEVIRSCRRLSALFASHMLAGGFGGNGQVSELSAGF